MEIKPDLQDSIESLTIDRLCYEVTISEEGKALIKELKKRYIEQSPFILADYSQFGGIANYLFFRQGEANVIRFIEQQARVHAQRFNQPSE